MDPDAIYRDIAQTAADILTNPKSPAEAYHLAVLWAALDDWLIYGGLLPKAWEKE